MNKQEFARRIAVMAGVKVSGVTLTLLAGCFHIVFLLLNTWQICFIKCQKKSWLLVTIIPQKS